MKKPSLGKKIVLGVTGSFGSGKSTVAGMFLSQGAKIIDADRIAHRCLQPGTSTYKQIRRQFGERVIAPDKQIDRQALAQVVFNSKSLLKKLDSIVHPPVIRAMKKEIRNKKDGVIVLDAPLLLEVGLAGLVDAMVVVRMRQPEQISRVENKTGMQRADILKRIKSQIPLSVKLRLADFVIDNNGTLKDARKQVMLIWRSLWKNWK
jgi:dephospho-CoA kinase